MNRAALAPLLAVVIAGASVTGWCERAGGWAIWHDDEGWYSAVGPNVVIEAYDPEWGWYRENYLGSGRYEHVYVDAAGEFGDWNALYDDHTDIAFNLVLAGNYANNCW